VRTALAALLCIALCIPATTAAAARAGRTADANNGFDTATLLPPAGEFVTETLDVTDDRADFYALDVSAGDIINLSLYIIEYVPSSPEQVNFNLGLFNPSRAVLGWSNSTYQYDSLKELAPVSGTYYVEVAAVSGNGNYSLDYSTGPAPTVKDGETRIGSLTNTTNRNTNWYRVQLKGGAAAEMFTASMHEDTGVNFDLYFMDLWSGYSFWYDISWAGDPDERVEAVATYTGYYYLKVYDYRGVGNYTLNITVEPAAGHAGSEPAGARAVAYNSSFSGHVDMAKEHYDWYKAELAQGETISASLGLDSQPSDMFSLSILQTDKSTLKDWSKTNYVDGTPPTLARVVSISKAAPAAGIYYIVVMAKVGLMPNVADLSDRNAASDYILTVNLSAHVPPPTNHPPAASPPGIMVEMDENSGYDFDLGRIFSDQDGDALRFTVQGAVHISVEVNASSRNASFVGAHNWYGSENITITASDPYDACATAWVNITVRHLSLPPEILEKAPADEELNGTNGSVLRFRVFASDPDGAPVSYIWKADGAPLAAAGNSTDWKVPSDAGTVIINVTVSNQNMSSSAIWRISCLPRQPLNVVIIKPFNNTAVKQGESLRFHAMVSGLPASDLANLTFSWYLGDKMLGDGDEFCTTALPVGTQRIEVRAENRSEPAQNGRASVVVFVRERPAAVDKTTILITWGAIGAAAAAAAIAVLALASRRKEPGSGDQDDERVAERSERERRRAKRKSRERRQARKRNR
jgi:hypothetical protein